MLKSPITPEAYIAAITDPARRAAVEALDKFIRKTAPKLNPHILGGKIGYGSYRYKSASGREGDWYLIGLANNKTAISVYICAMDGKNYIAESLADKLGKVSVGKSCINIKKLEDLHLPTLKLAIQRAVKLGGMMAT